MMSFEQSNEIDVFDFECRIIAALFFNSDDRSTILAKLKVKNFLDQNLRMLFYVISEMHNQNIPIDFLGVKSRLKTNEYENIEKTEEVLKHCYELGYIDNLNLCIKVVSNNSTKFEINKLAKEMLEAKIDPIDPKNDFSNWSSKFDEIVNSQFVEELEHISNPINEYLIKLENMSNNENHHLTGISSGYESIDAYTNGFQKGDLIILAARPSVGKTALSINFILNAAKSLYNQRQEGIVVFFSLEMSKEQILQRMVSNLASIDGNVLRSSYIDETNLKFINLNLQKLKNYPIYINDSPNMTILDIESKLHQISKEQKISLVVIDYLQLINSSFNTNNRVNEVARISRNLKALARELNIPLIALAQLSRKIEERKMEDRRPMLSDLRESGSIEQDADLVTFIDIDYSSITNNPNKSPSSDELIKYRSLDPIMNFYIEKHRNGMTGIVKLIFKKALGQFVSVDYDSNKGMKR